MKFRFAAALLALATPIVFTACSNKQESKEGSVFIESTWTETCYAYDVQPGSGYVVVNKMTFTSVVKNESSGTSSMMDVDLKDMWVFFKRLDGGREVPKPYHQRYSVQVPAAGSAKLDGAAVLGPEALLLPPFDKLYPENGGVDPDTGLPVIRLAGVVRFYGSTYAGQEISTEFTIPLDFRYGSGCNSPGSAAR